jgi:hypothetical protein
MLLSKSTYATCFFFPLCFCWGIIDSTIYHEDTPLMFFDYRALDTGDDSANQQNNLIEDVFVGG